ncbi:putative transposase [Canicola haemoglobinophilus]|nr:putative transposase [Canicola haemoglobinophilus]
MNEKQLHALAAEFAKTLKTPEDLNQFSRMLKKITVEAALNGELTDHLGYEKHQPRKGKNARNGYTSKTIICDEGEIEIDTPRDRDGSFEPQLIKKNQTRITGMDEQIIALYAKGLSNQEIVEMFKELYDADVSTSLISRVTDAVKERVMEWQNTRL